MIIDSLDNLKRYTGIPNLNDIISFLNKTDISGLCEGDIPIRGKELYVKVLRYAPKDASENNFEAHNIYTDVQVMVEGTELMQTAPLDGLKKIKADAAGDFVFFDAGKYISDIVVREGQFAVFFPNEAHKPGCRYQDLEKPVKKLVFKSKKENTAGEIV